MLFAILITTTHAFFLRDSTTGLYLGQHGGNIGMVRKPEEAAEIKLENTEPKTIATLINLGTKALRANDGIDKLDVAEIDRSNRNQFFKLILTRESGYILQHKDRCVGYRCVFPGIKDKGDIYKLGLVDCDNFANIIIFTKKEEAYELVKKKKIFTRIKPSLMHAEETAY
ncbi:hypothetical protein GINT2_000339 [Glugoides intestinalis]